VSGGWLLTRIFRNRARLELTVDADGIEDMTPVERRCLFAKRQEILRALNGNRESLFQSRIQVCHLMSHRLLTVARDAPADQLDKMMQENKVRHLLVCETNGKLAGVISDRDLRNRTGKTAADLMTPNPHVVSRNDPLGQVITLMMHRHISCVPVVEEGSLCGIVTSTDIMMSLHCTLQILAKLAAEVNASCRPARYSAFSFDDGVDALAQEPPRNQ
jgi:CBS domain-containing protein